MVVDRLAALVPPEVARQLPKLFERFRDEHRSEDPASFIATLADRGLIDAGTVRRALTGLDVSGTLDEAAAARGPRYRTLVPVGADRDDAWLARDRPLQRPVMVLSSPPGGSAEDVARVIREARVLAQLDHPGVLPVYSLDLEVDPSGRPLGASFATRAAEDRALDAALAEPGFSQRTALNTFVRVCDVVGHAHDQGLIHGDLTIANVRLGKFHEVFVTGWRDAAAPVAGRGVREDIRALVTLLACIAGPTPPPEIAAVLRADWTTAAALAADVRAWLRDAPMVAVPETASRKLGRWVGRHRDRVLYAALALVLLGVAVAGSAAIGTLVVVARSERAANAREHRLTALVTTTTAHADAIDLALRGYEGLLTGLVGAAELALATDPPDQPVYLGRTFQVPATGAASNDAFPPHAPPDLAGSPAYRAPISLGHPDVTAVPGYDTVAHGRRLRQLAGLRPAFLDVLARSAPEPLDTVPTAMRANHVFARGVPVVWAYVATEDGVIAGLPGTGDYPADYDPRVRPWYLAAKASYAPSWSAAYVDLNGMGLVVPCSHALRDAADSFVGVAAIDVSISWLIDELLRPEGLSAEAWLIDAEGKEIVRSSLADRARSGSAYEPAPFPWPDVPERVAAGEHVGTLVLPDGQIASWQRLDAVPWTYVLVGAEAKLLGS
jgi:serine/threonine protein kinase